ncbi:MAG: signal recognition particle protein [Oscillospiraceae bacterium]|nr:signal recognition particle protein [Oscillospiraceae bacterium]
MVFQNLTEKLSEVFRKLGSKGRLTEADVRVAVREIRIALLEADVNYLVVKEFTEKITERAQGVEITKSLTPAQMVIKIVNEELIALLGGKGKNSLKLDSKNLNVIMLCGLQGVGKTTQAVKLALHLKNKGNSPLLAACDIYRPAAIKQLEVLGKKAKIGVFSESELKPQEITKKAINFAKNHGNNILILDTAGRLHTNEDLMRELEDIDSISNPSEILLVLDAMTGQDAVSEAEIFNKRLNVTGIILTKFDGDTRGGAALSVIYTTGKPIKFVGTGEKVSDIEQFRPDRIASRILGMGDILSLIEKTEASIDKENAEKIAKKISENKFDFEDFLLAFNQIKKIGSFKSILERLPNIGSLNSTNIDDKMVSGIEAMILSMTPQERQNPEIISSGRRFRIAAGSGKKVSDVNELVKKFEDMRKMMKQFGITGKNGFKKGNFGSFFKFGKFR